MLYLHMLQNLASLVSKGFRNCCQNLGIESCLHYNKVSTYRFGVTKKLDCLGFSFASGFLFSILQPILNWFDDSKRRSTSEKLLGRACSQIKIGLVMVLWRRQRVWSLTESVISSSTPSLQRTEPLIRFKINVLFCFSPWRLQNDLCMPFQK